MGDLDDSLVADICRSDEWAQMLKLRQDPDEEWRELEELMKTNPRQATYRFQRQSLRLYNKFARRVLLPVAVPLLLSWWIFGQTAPLTVILDFVAIAAAFVCIVGLIVGFTHFISRDRLLRKYAAEYTSRFPDSRPETDYVIGQTWIIQHCLAEEKSRRSKAS